MFGKRLKLPQYTRIREASIQRPISLTSIASKVLESCLRDSMLHHLKVNNFLSNKQFGFLGGRSTTMQLLKVMDEWTEVLDRGGKLDVIYCDFRKAFDTVPHRRLMSALQHYHIEDPILSWVRDFLKNRKQQVRVNGEYSEVFDVLSGVPQGSVLGPLLFLIYINLLVETAGDADLYLYADDLKLFKEIKSTDDNDILQQNLTNLQEWTTKSLLRFHPDKCEVMQIKSKRAENTCGHYKIENNYLKNVAEVKDLGVHFDSNLTFENHINKKVNKANALVGMIRRTFVYMDKQMFKHLFVSIVRPHLEYAAPVWNPHQKALINLLENVQRRATKLIPGMKELSYKERLILLKLPTLQYRRYRGDMIELYKLSHGIYDEDVAKDFISFGSKHKSGYHLRGHHLSIYKEKYVKDIRKNVFKCRTVDQWNCLPRDVIEAETLNAFKDKLDKLWSDDVMYDFECNFQEMTCRTTRNTRR